MEVNLILAIAAFAAIVVIDIVDCKKPKKEVAAGSTTTTVEVVKWGVANLPCNVSLQETNDKVQTIIWYKEDPIRGEIPIYTFDARDKALDEGEHWSDERVLEKRAHFRYQEEPPKLILADIRETDAGIYHCRVDLKRNPTQNMIIKLKVVIPPDQLIFLNEKGSRVDQNVIGPYNEGDLINVTCVALGGRPQPNVTWWQENTLLDNVAEFSSSKRVKNVLHLTQLERKDLDRVITCQASNNNKAVPISNFITIDMNLCPIAAKLLPKHKSASSGIPYELSCEIQGSRPPAITTWWLEGAQMATTRELVTESNTTTSFLTFIPSLDDNGKLISCKATHQFIPNCVVQDELKLSVYHVPGISLSYNNSIDEDFILEGTDVEFNCIIKSNPAVITIGFEYNGETLYSNPSSGVTITNHTLTLSNVDRYRSGNYSCFGNNEQGRGESNTIRLDVKYAPHCVHTQSKVHRVPLRERIELFCQMDANPNNIQFTWHFKYNDGNHVKLPEQFVIAEGSNSTAHYTPSSNDDFPTLICSGNNTAGDVQKPCVFHLLSVDSPEAPSNCKVTKQTENSLHVECIDELNGGIRGEFIIEVYDAQTGKLVRNVTSRDPTFIVRGLESGIGFDVDLYVANKDGKSLVTRLPTFTLTSGKLGDEDDAMFLSISALLFVLVGVVLGLILLAVTIVVVIRCRGDNNSASGCSNNDNSGYQKSSGHCITPLGSDKFNRKAGSNTSYDSFDTVNRDST